MIYVVVLNWNSAKDTVNCVESILQLDNSQSVKIVVCDNNSDIDCFSEILTSLQDIPNISLLSMTEKDISDDTDGSHNIVLIRNDDNYGYAGGNNIGIKYALNQADMEYVWILNNDTEVAKQSLIELLKKIKSDECYGIVGSKLIDYSNREKIQGIGGIINQKFCTTREIGGDLSINDIIDEKFYEEKVNYLIGASLLFSRRCIEKVGLLCEDYFLYYEEIDMCIRAQRCGFKMGIASHSLVYHKQGATTNKGKSDIADYCSVRNRILVCKKFFKKNVFFAKLALLGVIFNRIKRREFKRVIKYISFLSI